MEIKKYSRANTQIGCCADSARLQEGKKDKAMPSL